jgi:hypothetical protein
MSFTTSALIAASFLVAAALSAVAIASHGTSRATAVRAYEWSAESAFSADARRARDQSAPAIRPGTQWGRISLDVLT